jgi:uncharacterized protein YwgA
MEKSLVDPKGKVSNMDASQKIILYCMGVLGKPIEKRVDIQKIIFLSNMSLPEIFEDLYTFQKHKKGPYSERIDEDLNVLSNSGLIAGPAFNLSDTGREVYKEIDAKIEEPLKGTISDNKDFVSGLSEDELLTFIYAVFPEFIENSEVWEKLEPNRMKYAESMLKKEKITASLASEIAGMNYFEFEDHLRKQKVRWKS